MIKNQANQAYNKAGSLPPLRSDEYQEKNTLQKWIESKMPKKLRKTLASTFQCFWNMVG
jgi:hypothetical protein